MSNRSFNKIHPAITHIIRNLRTKRAGARSDVVLQTLPQAIPGVSTAYAPFDLLGTGLGLLNSKNNLDLDTIRKMDASPEYALLPGVGRYRTLYRRRLLRNLLKDKEERSTVSVPISEYLGPLTSTLGLGAAGALAGAAIGKGTGSNDISSAMTNGGLAGLGVGASSVLVGALAALFNKKRSMEEQGAYENDRDTILKNYLLPGVAAYNQFKSIGAATHLSEPDFDYKKVSDQ